MRLFLLILLVGSALADEKVAKITEKTVESVKKSAEDSKSKTGKRESSNQTSSFGINTNDEPFKPINAPAPFEAAASDTQQVYYDKNQLKAGEGGAGNAKSDTNPPATNAYRLPYSQVPQHQQYQQQQQQHHTKNHLRAAIKNAAIQQQQQQQLSHNQPSILYAAPPNPAYHYERIPQQPQQQIQIPVVPPVPAQRGQQKSIQYVIAIPLSYLRQFQQQILHQQQQEQLQLFKGQQQPQQQLQQQQQLQPLPVYSIAGPLARDNHGAYRPFHRFAPAAVNDVSSGTPQQQQTVSVPAAPQHLVPAPAAAPGYVTQYIQIPASVLLAAAQSAQVQLQQQQRPIHLPQNVYQQQPQIQLQQPIHQQQQQQQQHAQTLAPQLYYYQPQQLQLQHQQQQQQQVQLKQSQPSPVLTSPPVYVHPIQQQLQQPTQQHQTFQHLAEQHQQQQQQQQINVGKKQHSHRVRGVRPSVTFTPSQYDSSVTAYESEEKAQLVALQAPAHTNLKAHTHTNAHSQQYIAQAPVAPPPQQLHQPTATAHQLVQAKAPEVYEHIIPYSPQYIEQYQVQQQHQQPQQQPRHHQAHRLQIQPQQHTQLVEHLNNLQLSQGTHSPTPLPFLRLHTPAATGVTPIYNLNSVTTPAIHQPFFSGTYQPAFTPLGTPSKVTSFTNVLLQPFVGHSSSFASPEIGTAVADSLPFIHHTGGGVRYATHLYHPPTSAATLVAGNNKQHHSVGAQAHPSPRVLNTAGEGKVSAASSAKVATVSASPTIVKYP